MRENFLQKQSEKNIYFYFEIFYNFFSIFSKVFFSIKLKSSQQGPRPDTRSLVFFVHSENPCVVFEHTLKYKALRSLEFRVENKFKKIIQI